MRRLLLPSVVALCGLACSPGDEPSDAARREFLQEAPRPFAVRLADGRHDECREAIRCGASGEADFETLSALERRIEPSTQAGRHAAVVLRLALDGDDDSLDAAVEELIALSAATPSAARWNDLAAVYFVRAAALDRPRDLARALSASRSAVALDAESPTAWFNRAIIADRLSLWSDAETSWRRVLELESDPGWRQEAELRLQRSREKRPPHKADAVLERAIEALLAGEGEIAAELRQPLRRRAEEELLPLWAARESGEEEGDPRPVLEQIRAIGEARAAADDEIRGDELIRASVDAIRDASEDERTRLARGHRAFGEGMTLFRKDRIAAAEEQFLIAEEALAASPFLPRVKLQRRINAYYHFRYEEVFAALERDLTALNKQRFPALAGRMLWIQALTLGSRGRIPPALEKRYQAREFLASAGEISHTVRLDTMIAENLLNAGELDDAWRRADEALRKLRRVWTPQGRLSVLYIAAELAQRGGELEAARAFHDARVAAAREAQPLDSADALLRRARTLAESGEFEQAEEDLKEARRAAEQIPDDAAWLRRRIRGDAARQLAAVRAKSDPATALTSLQETLDLYDLWGYGDERPSIYALRARIELELGRRDDAEATLRQGIEEYETRRADMDLSARATYFERARPLFVQWIGLLAERGAAEEALAAVVRSRARTLREQALQDPAIAPTTPEEIRFRLRPDEALLVFDFVSLAGAEHLVSWSVRGDGVGMTSKKITAAETEEIVRTTVAAILDDDPAARDGLRSLYDLLIAPHADRLTTTQRLILSPQGALFAAPFAALLDADGRFLSERFEISVSIAATPPPPDRSPPQAALVIGDPSFDRIAFFEVDRLNGAAEEARETAALYPSAELWIEENAVVRRFLNRVRDYEVLHLAAHGLADPRDAGRSALLLASEGEHSGALRVQELQPEALRGVRLAVLAACSSGIGPTSAEGPESFVHPFLRDGADAVVATLWPISDETSRELFLTFHRRVRAGDSPATALRAAQSEARGGALRHWAALRVYSGLSMRSAD